MEPKNHCAENVLASSEEHGVEEQASDKAAVQAEPTENQPSDEAAVQAKSAEGQADGGEEASPAEELASEIEEHSGFYRMLSKLFYWPYSQEELDAIDADDFRALSESAPDALMAQGYNDMYRSLRRRTTGTREILNSDFTRCFMGTTTFRGIACVPYASIFLNPGGELMGKARNEIRRVYRANRVELEEGVDLPEDHLSFELEFMAILGDRCAQALREGSFAEAQEALDTQAQFLERYILSWTDRLFDLSVELVRTRFYRGVIKVAKGFLAGEPDAFEALSSHLKRLQASAA